MVLKAEHNRFVVALAGGVGGAKLAYGLSKTLPPEQLVIVGNVADDVSFYGLHVSPDLDTVMYTLSEVANADTGWGLSGDSWQMVDMLRQYGEDVWFNLGDRDLATNVLRTKWLAEGLSLTEVTARLARGLGMQHRLLPVTDDPVETMVETVEHGTLPFQEYFVRYRWQPTVTRLAYRGAGSAQASAPVIDALQRADVIVLCPSNPVLSIEPILAVPGIRETIRQRSGRCVAVSPFVGGKAVKGPADKLMGELGLGILPSDLIDYYAGLLDGLVVDVADRQHADALDLPVLVTQSLMKTSDDKLRLAEEILDWVEGLT